MRLLEKPDEPEFLGVQTDFVTLIVLVKNLSWLFWSHCVPCGFLHTASK